MKRISPHEKFDLHKFTRCKYGAKSAKTSSKSKVNAAFACQFTWAVVNLRAIAVFTIFAFYLPLQFALFCSKFALSKFDVNQIFRSVLFHVTVENTEIFYISYHLIKFEKRYLET